MNSVYLRRSQKVVIEPERTDSGKRSPAEIATFQKNLEFLGFALSQEAAAEAAKLDAAKFEEFYRTLIDQIRIMTGDHRPLDAMYRDFPRQVMEMSEAELYLNALYHYITLDMPTREKTPRPKLLDRTDLKLIRLGSVAERNRIFTNLCAAKGSLSASDKEDMLCFVKGMGNEIQALIPDNIPTREIVATLGAGLFDHTNLGEEFLSRHASSATDVLRLAVALSDGDVSLFEPCKFGRFSRGRRKLMLSLIERASDPTGDMLRWKGRWIRLGERLHPGEYAEKFPRTAEAFSIIRNSLPFQTENSRLEAMFESADTGGLIVALSANPGVFARRLDHLLRICEEPDRVLEAFRAVSEKVATPILLRMMSHFEFRERQKDYEKEVEENPEPVEAAEEPPEKSSSVVKFLKSCINVVGPGSVAGPVPIRINNELVRVFFPKGDLAKVYARAEPLPLLPEGVAGKAAEICREALERIFAAKPSLGKCWVDDALKNYRVATAQRSASKSLRTLSRGTRLPIPVASTLRFFIWWMNGDYRTDIDLSAVLYDDQFTFIDDISYYNLKRVGGHHSGDIVDAPEGAAEFIDLDLAKTREAGVRYVVMVVNSFTQQPYCDLPECFAGWMARQFPNSGEIFEARTVQDKVDLASDTRISLPAIFDLEAGEVIWCDLALRNQLAYNNVANNLRGISLMVRSMVSLKTPNLYDLFTLHGRSRGELVGAREEADIVFSVEEGDVTPFDLEEIAAEYL